MSGGRLISSLRDFCTVSQANITITFALALVPIVAGVGAAVDYSQANSMRSAMQAAGDATALALVAKAGSETASQISSDASSYFLANFNRPTANNVSVSSSYNSSTYTLTITATASYMTKLLGAMGVTSVALSTTSIATTAGKTYTICVMINDPSSGHTERTSNGAGLVFNNCINQVNTNDWDAVQADDNSYIHGTQGSNCFVGDIHFGDVTPPKEASCTLFPDPFSSYAMPASASNCDYGTIAGKTGNNPKYKMPNNATSVVLSPGTYCQGLQLQGGSLTSVTFNPGVYIIAGGQLQMQGQSNNWLIRRPVSPSSSPDQAPA
jgi:Flp pilus assembly protein TadG